MHYDDRYLTLMLDGDMGGLNGQTVPMGSAGFRRDYAGANGANGADGATRRTIPADWLVRHLLGGGNVVEAPVEINHAVIEGALDLSNVTFKCALSITDTEFRGEVNFSFATFERGVNFGGSRFRGAAYFRAARYAGDLRLALSEFDGPACFEDIHVEEVCNAEGAVFVEGADFSRACFDKKAHFCCALLADGRSRRTEFRGEARFNDARACGPAYFNGALFGGRAGFDRAAFDSSAFFSCDALTSGAGVSSQPRHEPHPAGAPGALRQEVVQTVFAGDACFVGLRVSSSITFSGAHFQGEADFRRVAIDGTALFNPFPAPDGLSLQPVRFGRDADFWNADIKGAARFEAAQFEGGVRFQNACIGRDADFSPQLYGRRALRAFFGADANFNDAHICGSLIINAARFNGRADFMQINVDGRADFRAFEIPDTDSIISAFFGGEANFRGAHVKGSVNFDGAVFADNADFQRLRAEGGVLFRALAHTKNRQLPAGKAHENLLVPVRFWGQANFAGAKIGNNMEFDGARFSKEASFERIEVRGDVYFRPWEVGAVRVRFGSKAIFIGASVGGSVEFSGAAFAGDADFSGLQVSGSAYFDGQHHYDERDGRHYSDAARRIPQLEFAGETQFSGARFTSEVDFTRAVFRRAADFNGVVVEGKADFEQARFGDAAVFSAAVFKNAAHFDGSAFAGRADFTSVTVTGTTFFPGATFDGPAVFSSTVFRSELDFGSARFRQTADFTGTLVEGTASFLKATFGEAVVFRDGNFIALVFCEHPQRHPRGQFPLGRADLRGLTYQRIEVDIYDLLDGVDYAPNTIAERLNALSVFNPHYVSRAEKSAAAGSPQPPPRPRRSLLGDILADRLDGTLADRLINGLRNLLPSSEGTLPPLEADAADELIYDRQPYTQLIKVLYATGHDSRAEKVYLIQRGRERRRRWGRIRKSFRRNHKTGEYRLADLFGGAKKVPSYLLDLFHWGISNYGVRPMRLVLLSALVIALGVVMFSRAGAVELRDAEEAAQQLREIRQQLGEAATGTAAPDGRGSQSRRCYASGAETDGRQVCDLDWPEAIGVSLCQFIPIIEIPSGSR
jgi:uncharacterized protein YjbI with pentapeptide repeats